MRKESSSSVALLYTQENEDVYAPGTLRDNSPSRETLFDMLKEEKVNTIGSIMGLDETQLAKVARTLPLWKDFEERLIATRCDCYSEYHI